MHCCFLKLCQRCNEYMDFKGWNMSVIQGLSYSHFKLNNFVQPKLRNCFVQHYQTKALSIKADLASTYLPLLLVWMKALLHSPNHDKENFVFIWTVQWKSCLVITADWQVVKLQIALCCVAWRSWPYSPWCPCPAAPPARTLSWLVPPQWSSWR